MAKQSSGHMVWCVVMDRLGSCYFCNRSAGGIIHFSRDRLAGLGGCGMWMYLPYYLGTPKEVRMNANAIFRRFMLTCCYCCCLLKQFTGWL